MSVRRRAGMASKSKALFDCASPSWRVRSGMSAAVNHGVKRRQDGDAGEQGESRAVAGELDREAGGRGSDESGDRDAERERGEVARALGLRAERADQVVRGHVKENMPQADCRRAEEQRGHARHCERKREPGGHDQRSADDRQAHAETIRQPPCRHREEQGKQREQCGEHADRGGARAELEGVERDRDFAAAQADRCQRRQQNHEVNGHRCRASILTA